MINGCAFVLQQKSFPPNHGRKNARRNSIYSPFANRRIIPGAHRFSRFTEPALIFELAFIIILLAFAFSFTNGFQDASSIAATFIASRSAASPKAGIILVSCMSFLGAMLGGSAVAFTLTGLVSVASGKDMLVILLVALLTATAWNIIIWRSGLPSSSTHSLVGGLVGGGIAAAGTGSILWGAGELIGPAHELTGLVKILAYFILSLLIGLFGSFVMHRIIVLFLRNAKRSANRRIVIFNWCGAAGMAFFNGANDSQKQLGFITLTLTAAGLAAGMYLALAPVLGV